MQKLLMAVFALTLLAGCSSESGKPAETAKPQPKPPDVVTGRAAFQKLYISAHGWGRDAQAYRLESSPNRGSNGHEGKAAICRAGLASVAQRGPKPYVWSGSDPDRGV